MKRADIISISAAAILAFSFIVSGCDQAPQNLSVEKVRKSFNNIAPETDIKDVRPTPVRGVYEVVAESKDGRQAIVYMSSDTKFLFTGELIDVDKKENLTTERVYDLSKVDFSSIPLANSIVLGSPDAENKVFVFSDPSCLPCALYHEELKKAVRENDNLAVFLKIFALPNLYPKSYEKARAIHCGKDNEEALSRLDALYAAETVPYPDCKDSAVDENMAIASSLKITRSPTTVFPNGVKISELMRAADFIKQLERRGGNPAKKAKATEATPYEQGTGMSNAESESK